VPFHSQFPVTDDESDCEPHRVEFRHRHRDRFERMPDRYPGERHDHGVGVGSSDLPMGDSRRRHGADLERDVR